MLQVQRTGIVLQPNQRRVLFRPFTPTSEERIIHIIGRILSLSEAEVENQLAQVCAEFGERHHNLGKFFLKRYEQLRKYALTDQPLSQARRMLIGAYFTQEYALESAGLLNPSIVWHPDQSDLPEGCRRFILSLRAIGEGHISSVTFRSGMIDAENHITLYQPTRFVTLPEIAHNPLYDKQLFQKKLVELGLYNDFSRLVLEELSDFFTYSELETRLRYSLEHGINLRSHRTTARGMLSLATSNYEIRFSPDQQLSERIIYPSTPAEIKGIEDARFVEFHDEDGSTTYYATYTAYDGTVILPQLLETKDFLHFKISTLNGPAIQNKGMALFPRKIRGKYVMLGRQDNENLYLMVSDHIHFWYTHEILLHPTYPWEFVQIGNCGSPLETEAGWLVLTHGVGAMRKYSIGAVLLDLEDPSKVIGRLKEPLLGPNENEREGYVPNVVYSCGSVIHNRHLILPYAMSDYASTFAIIPLDDLLSAMQ